MREIDEDFMKSLNHDMCKDYKRATLQYEDRIRKILEEREAERLRISSQMKTLLKKVPKLNTIFSIMNIPKKLRTVEEERILTSLKPLYVTDSYDPTEDSLTFEVPFLPFKFMVNITTLIVIGLYYQDLNVTFIDVFIYCGDEVFTYPLSQEDVQNFFSKYPNIQFQNKDGTLYPELRRIATELTEIDNHALDNNIDLNKCDEILE